MFVLLNEFYWGKYSKRIRWTEHVERVGDKMDACWDLVGRFDREEILLDKTERRRIDNIKMDIHAVG
jgi:hypothetical protein